ncbi:MAG: SRPBCC family protein [Pseudomonadota bacterium]
MEFIKIAGYAALGIAALSAATFALPRHISVERSAVLNASAEDVLALAASNEGYQAFNPYRSMDPKLKIEMFGPENGIGSGFRFNGKDGKGTQTVANITGDTVTYAIDMGFLGKPTQAIRAVPVAEGTEVTWRVDSDMGFNPIFRVFGLFMDGMMGRTFELGLENLREAAA